MEQIVDYLFSKEIIWSVVIGFSLSFFFMRFIPNQKQRKVLRIFFWFVAIGVPLIIIWWTGDYTWIARSAMLTCVPVLITLKDVNLKRAEIRQRKRQIKG